ncbi:MAG: haloalkane dehalogenase [Acidobacteriota bacterium]
MSAPEISAEFPYQSRYVEVLGSKIHYIDEGLGDPILFLHGNPTSSYLWRNVIPHLTPMARCIAPDLIGMGKSDKPDIDYRFADHVRYIEGFIEKLGLEKITLVIHDWGSGIGFHYAMRHEGNVKGLAFMEAIFMPVPSWEVFPPALKGIFQAFRTPEVGWRMIVDDNIFIEKVLPGGVVRGLTEEEMRHYREPYTEPSSRKPLWRWPNEIPIEGKPADVAEAVEGYHRRLRRSELPKLLFCGDPGALNPAPMVEWCEQNLRALQTVSIGPGIHYLQEDNPHLIGRQLADWYGGL